MDVPARNERPVQLDGSLAAVARDAEELEDLVLVLVRPVDDAAPVGAGAEAPDVVDATPPPAASAPFSRIGAPPSSETL